MLKHTQPRLSQLASAVAVVLGGITLLPAAHAAAPAAGASISNIASASYTDATGAPQTVTSNEVRTTVIQVASFTLVADRTALATPNSTVNLSHTLTNTGNGTDTFTIALVNESGDAIDLNGIAVYIDANGDGAPDNTTNVTSVTLAPGESVNLIAVGTTPVTAQSGNQALVTISATTAKPLAPSQVAAGATVSNTDTVTITGGGVVSVVKSANVATVDMSSVAGRTITYTLRYTNSGNATATDVVLTDVLPANVAYRTGFTTWSNAAGSLTEASGDDIFTLNSVTNTLTFNVGSVPANTTGTLTFQVIVDEDAAVGDVINVAQFAYDPDGAGVGQPAVPATNTNQVPVEVPANRSGSINDSTNDPFADNQPVGGGALLSPTDGDTLVNDEQTIASIAQGASATFRTYVHNTGNLAQVFEVLLPTIPAGATVQLFQADGVTPLTNVSGTTAVDIGPIPVGGIREVVVVVSLPNTTSGNNGGAGFVTLVEVRPVGAAASVKDTTTLTIAAVTAARVDLHNNNAAVDNNLATDQLNFGEGVTTAVIDTLATTPTNAVTFPLGVFNGSNSPDNFNLTVPNLPAGWTAVFLDANGNAVTNTGNIPKNTEASLTVVITPPAGTLVGDYPIDFRIASPGSGLTDTMRNQVTVTEVRQLSLVPNRTGQVAPGGTIVYSHTLTNNGNTTEGAAAQSAEAANNSGLRLAIAQAAGAGTFTGNVTVAVDLDNDGQIDTNEIVTAGDLNQRLPAGLAAGASATILVQVQAPAGALPGQENSTTIKVDATTAINGVAAPAAVEVIDVTTVTAGQIRLVKTQAVDADCNGTADAAYGQGVISAQPGQCVVYRIVAKNEGNAAVSGVVVTDATPASTTINRRLLPTPVNVVVNPAANGFTAPADGATGTVSYDVGPLAPAATAQLDFGVKIDQ